MVADRFIGALCLGLAAVTVTWGADVGEARLPGDRRPPVLAGPEGRRERIAGVDVGVDDIPAPATLARRILVTPGDLPPGFVVVGEPPPEGSDADGGFVRCLGAEAPTLKAAVRARSYSGELAKDGAGSVSSSAVAFDSPASATRVVDILSSPSARDCFEEVINERLSLNPALPAGARGTLNALDVGVLGEGATGFRFEVTLPAEAVAADPSEGDVPYIGDFYFVRRDRALAVLEFGNLRRPFSPEDARAVAMSVIGRAG